MHLQFQNKLENAKEGFDNNNVEEKAKTKENELQQIKEMFGSKIDQEIINDYWHNLNADYVQTISVLSEMVEEMDKQKKIEETKNTKPKIEENKL